MGCQGTGTPVCPLDAVSHVFIHLFPEPSIDLPRELPYRTDKPAETLHHEADSTTPVSWFTWKKQISLCCSWQPRYFQFGDQELDKPKEKQPTLRPLTAAARQHGAVCGGAVLLQKSYPAPLPKPHSCAQRVGGTASQQHLAHRVIEKWAGPFQPFFSSWIWAKNKSLFWRKIPQNADPETCFHISEG